MMNFLRHFMLYLYSYTVYSFFQQNDSLDREKKLVTLAIERLQEVHTLITSREVETNWCEKKYVERICLTFLFYMFVSFIILNGLRNSECISWL